MPKIQLSKILFYSFALVACLAIPLLAQPQFKVGERITYSVSYDTFRDVAYAELFVASQGTLAGKDAVEIRSRIKTLSLISAAFYQVDESRTVFVDPASGFPLYVSRVLNPEGIRTETVNDLQRLPSVNFDLISLIYKIRQSNGSGAANFQEGEKVYGVTFQPTGSERVSVPAGEFDTTIVSVESEFFAELGFPEVKVNLTNDDARIPVVVRLMRNKKSGFRAEAASVQSIVPEPVAAASPTPTPQNTPRPTPTPASTPEPYIPNRPLAPELAFEIGETLEYRLTAAGRPVGTFVTRARERLLSGGKDTLVLTATVTNAAPGNPIIQLNDSITANVDPETLAPRQLDIKTSGSLAFLSQTALFDERTGTITFGGANRIEAPIATHSILSLLYAMRSFNLRQSPIRDNPVNDTRVAVFWENQPYIFTLRPSQPEVIEIGGQKRQAQMVAVNTGNPQLDQLAIKVWLSTDQGRMPLRITIGPYQADLVSASVIPPR